MFRIAQALSIAYLLLALVLVGLQFRPPAAPVTISVVYGTEKRDWLEAAAAHFAARNPTVNGRPIVVELQGLGSRETVVQIVEGTLKPTVISPASSIWIELLRDEWQTRTGQHILYDGSDGPRQLVVTPLVVVMWEERAQVLGLDASGELWQSLHQLVADNQGWKSFGHPEWGFVQWGHTNPETSNSGTQTLVLLAYAYHNKARSLMNADILAPDFQQWFADFERAVTAFPDSTGNLMDDMLRFGPSKYSFIVVYENLAIESFGKAQGRGGPLRAYYPPANILSDHPYAILNAEWVTEEQRQAAAAFRDFLLNPEMQTLALMEYGFRPGNPDIAFNVAGNPFTRFAENGIQMDINQTVEVPPAGVLNELLNLWRRGDYDR